MPYQNDEFPRHIGCQVCALQGYTSPHKVLRPEILPRTALQSHESYAGGHKKPDNWAAKLKRPLQGIDRFLSFDDKKRQYPFMGSH
jgi:hypothetical protein